MIVTSVAGGAEIARRCLPTAVQNADVVSVVVDLGWRDSGVRILRLDYQFMTCQRSWTGREAEVWGGIVTVQRKNGRARLESHGEYSKDQATALAIKMGRFPPMAMDLRHIDLDLAVMENRLATLLPMAPNAHTLALRQEEGQPVWSLVAEKLDGEVVTVHWNALTGDCTYSMTESTSST